MTDKSPTPSFDQLTRDRFSGEHNRPDDTTPEPSKEAQEDELIANIERILQRQLDGQEPLRLSQQRRLIGLFDTEPLRQLCRDQAEQVEFLRTQVLDLDAEITRLKAILKKHKIPAFPAAIRRAARKAGVTE